MILPWSSLRNVVAVALGLLVASQTHAQFPPTSSITCSRPSIRSEWRQLSSSEQAAYLRAVQALKDRSPGPDADPSRWNYDQFVKAHLDMSGMAHSTPVFFPWHRAFVNAYEMALQSVDGSVTVAYWDWSLDSADITAAPVFGPDAFGGNGNGPTHCVVDGLTKGWQVKIRERVISNQTCLVRQFSFSRPMGGISKSVMDGFYRDNDNFEAFSAMIEGSPHGAIHTGIGEDMKIMSSPNDPLFFLHHAFVDKIWAKWQSLCPEYVNDFSDKGANLHPLGARASDVLVPGSPGACFQYSNDDNDGGLAVQCKTPPGTATETQAPPAMTVVTMTNSLGEMFTSVVVPTTTRASMSPTATATPTPKPPKLTLANFTEIIDTSADFWLRDELRSLLFADAKPPMLPVPQGSATSTAAAPSVTIGVKQMMMSMMHMQDARKEQQNVRTIR